MAKPRIFLSSTCYDLSDARAALTTFLGGFGFEVLNTADVLICQPSVRRREPARRQVRRDVCVEDDRGTRKDDPSPKSGAMRAA